MESKQTKFNFFQAIKSLDKHKKFMVFLFIVFFFLGAIDRKTYLYVFEHVMFMPNLNFWGIFAGFYLIFTAVIIFFPRVVRVYSLNSQISKGRYIARALAISMYAFFVGEMVSVTNALIVAVFERLAWFG